MTYLNRRKRDCENLQQLFSTLVGIKNPRQEQISELAFAFKKKGHQMLGNARSYNFASLEPIALRFDNLLPFDVLKTGPLLLEEFSSWINQQLKLT